MPLTEIRYHNPSAAIFCWDRSGETCRAWSYLAHRPLPDDAPDEAKAIAAQHWTPEVIRAAKAKMQAAPRKEVAAPVLSPVAERVAAAEQRADANMLSMAQMVMATKDENTLAVGGLQAQIDGLNKELADLRSKVTRPE